MRLDRDHLKEAVAKILLHHVGHANPIKMVELFNTATGEVLIPNRKYDQTRIIRSVVGQLRAEGWAICYYSDGYFLAQGWEEIEPTVKHLESRAIASFQTAANLRRCSIQDLLRHYQHNLPTLE